MDTNAFADRMGKMLNSKAEEMREDKDQRNRLLEYFSSHPPSVERIGRLERNKH